MKIAFLLAPALCMAAHSLLAISLDDNSPREETPAQKEAPWSVVGEWKATVGGKAGNLSIRQDGSFSGLLGANGKWALSAAGGTPLLVLRRDGGGADTLEMRGSDHFQGEDRDRETIDLRRGQDEPPAFRRDRAPRGGGKMRDAFSGKLRFHQNGGKLIYDLVIDHGRVHGTEHFGDADHAVAHIVGGWYDREGKTLSLLIEGSDGANERWRVQAQQFTLNPEEKTLTLEHALYGKGLTSENSKLTIDHTLDLQEAAP